MQSFDRVTLDPAVMGGKACIRGMRVTVSMVVGLLAAGHSPEEILGAYPYLEPEDITQSLVLRRVEASRTRGSSANVMTPALPYNSTSKTNVRNEANDLPPAPSFLSPHVTGVRMAVTL